MKAPKNIGPTEHHPYDTFIPEHAKAMIIGSFPIAKFTHPQKRKTIKSHEIDFSYGGGKNKLWPLLSIAFHTELKTKEQVVALLERKGIALGDVIKSCRRIEGSASDCDLRDLTYNHELREKIIQHSIETLFFTSSKVQEWFHSKIGKIKGVKEVVLMSCSASGLRSIPNHLKAEHQKWKIRNPTQRATDFRIQLYQKIFNEKAFPDLE